MVPQKISSFGETEGIIGTVNMPERITLIPLKERVRE